MPGAPPSPRPATRGSGRSGCSLPGLRIVPRHRRRHRSRNPQPLPAGRRDATRPDRSRIPGRRPSLERKSGPTGSPDGSWIWRHRRLSRPFRGGRSEGVHGVPPGVLDRLMRRKQNSSGGMVNKPWIDVVNRPWTNSAAGLVFPTWRSRLVRQASQAPPPTEPTGLSPITGARQFGSATYQVGDCAKGLCGPRQDALHLIRAPRPIAGGADPACGPVCKEVDNEGAPAFKVEASPRDDNKAHAHILSAIQRGNGTLHKLRNLLLPHLNRQLMELREYARPVAEP